jgi:hypothetical protein
MRADRATLQYLARHAEPEARVVAASAIGSFEHVLIVPACRESPALLDGYRDASRCASGRVLCILVVNGAAGAVLATRDANRSLLDGVRARLLTPRGMSGLELGSAGDLDVLLVDRASPGRELPARQGVGLARKVGLDVALALWHSDRAGPFAHTTDADVTLPGDYFSAVCPSEAKAISAAIYPFRHVSSGESAVDARTHLHEIFLRYWVAGLRAAGSPYAFHTIGSTLVVSLPSYARVRGVPKREAGEDFYLLNKLAKVAPVRRLVTCPIEITARQSDRTPFGTGRAVERLSQEDLALPDPRSFERLGDVLEALDDLAIHGDPARFRAALSFRLRPAVQDQVAGAQALQALGRVCAASTPADRRARLHGWFDAFRTMRFIHALSETTFPNAPWRRALAEAKFVPGAPTTLSDALARLVTAEGAHGYEMGPSALRCPEKAC